MMINLNLSACKLIINNKMYFSFIKIGNIGIIKL